jgi:hypothetical protein
MTGNICARSSSTFARTSATHSSKNKPVQETPKREPGRRFPKPCTTRVSGLVNTAVRAHVPNRPVYCHFPFQRLTTTCGTEVPTASLVAVNSRYRDADVTSDSGYPKEKEKQREEGEVTAWPYHESGFAMASARRAPRGPRYASPPASGIAGIPDADERPSSGFAGISDVDGADRPPAVVDQPPRQPLAGIDDEDDAIDSDMEFVVQDKLAAAPVASTSGTAPAPALQAPSPSSAATLSTHTSAQPPTPAARGSAQPAPPQAPLYAGIAGTDDDDDDGMW